MCPILPISQPIEGKLLKMGSMEKMMRGGEETIINSVDATSIPHNVSELMNNFSVLITIY